MVEFSRHHAGLRPVHDSLEGTWHHPRAVPKATWAVTRSLHSLRSSGPERAEYITSGEKLDLSLDLDSPLGRLYELDGHVLLLGAGHDSNTFWGGAEYLQGADSLLVDCFAPVQRDGAAGSGRAIGISISAPMTPRISGPRSRLPGGCRIVRWATRPRRPMRQRGLVDFGAAWMREHRAAAAI